jgi:hypothetical protein
MCQELGRPAFLIIEEGLTKDLGWKCQRWCEAGAIGAGTDRTLSGVMEIIPWRTGKGCFINSEESEIEFVIFADCPGFDDIYHAIGTKTPIIIEWGGRLWNEKAVVTAAGVIRPEE